MNIEVRKVVRGLGVALLATGLGCGQSWQMDYGEPAAQFLSTDLGEKGRQHLGKKITVRGIVTQVDTDDSEVAWLYLDQGVRCNFGQFSQMAESISVGETVYVDGFLKQCKPGNILLEPALLRDGEASFLPTP